MSKMREAFEKWCRERPTPLEAIGNHAALFFAGYQAALADVKAGGTVACIVSSNFCECNKSPLYKLPEDV